MKTYQVELQRVSYITITVEAENKDKAEDAAWLELEKGEYGNIDAEWSVAEVWSK